MLQPELALSSQHLHSYSQLARKTLLCAFGTTFGGLTLRMTVMLAELHGDGEAEMSMGVLCWMAALFPFYQPWRLSLQFLLLQGVMLQQIACLQDDETQRKCNEI